MDELHLTPREIAARIRQLIARGDGGDSAAAAQRLGVPHEHLLNLESVLERDARLEDASTVELLSRVVRNYQVDACWLLIGREAAELSTLNPLIRLRVAALLGHIADRIMREYRRVTRIRTSRLPLDLTFSPPELPPPAA